MRKILLYAVKNPLIPEKIKKDLDARNTIIEHISVADSNNLERLELYGYDGTLIYTTKNISSRSRLITALKTCIARIDKMPMGVIEKSIRTRKHLLDKCGLPDVLQTSHCFADSTHHTCCMLGPKSREYADSTGNPIGSASVRMQEIRNRNTKKSKTNKNKTKKLGLTPWCTCTGSKVCSYYTSKFGKEDGTHIKFIGTSKNENDNKNKNENKAILEMGLSRHETPGILENISS